MFVKSITLDGFKSYAQRVDVTGFDAQFNAITGLNGSGKSNILDSICFVLGITNLSSVRASNLQDLVYKQGQAGVTKATVSIVFDNSGKENSPVGYDHLDEITVTRQLVIGGRNKYLINGKTADQNRVQNLFHSVQLNVNNPHFLIMQGRITKVLNMKPPEILGLLEEAAGTKMYETKKQAAVRTLEKKQLKVDEINKVLSEDIMPALDTLRKEKVQYMEWQNASSKMERLQRYCVAYKYAEAKALLVDGEEEVKEAVARLAEVESQLEDAGAQMRRKADDVKSLRAEKEKEEVGEVKGLAQETDRLSKQIVQETSRLNNLKEVHEAEMAGLVALHESLKDLDESKIKGRIDAARARRDEAVGSLERAIAEIEAARSELAGAEAGDGRDASNRSLQERLEDAMNGITEADGAVKSAQTAVKHQQKMLSEATKELKAKEKNGSQLQREFHDEQLKIQKMKEMIEGMSYDEMKAQVVESRIEEEEQAVRMLADKADQMSSRVGASEFHFKDPVKGFDRAKVKGVVSRLVHISDPKYSSALEVAAGGKLYQVIVDSEQTAKQLLSGGQLRNRVTIIPLNKVSARPLQGAAKAAAAELAGDKAIPALELVGYDSELEAAMRYAFGSAFVCNDSATARKLAFHKDVASRCVTLDGDDFNPSGTLTGGSRSKTNSILSQLHALAACEVELSEHKERLATLKAELGVLNTERAKFEKVKKEIELKGHSLELLQKRLEGSEVHQLRQAVAEHEAELEAAQEQEASMSGRQAELRQLAESLKKQIINFDKEKEIHVKQAQEKLGKAKEEVEAAKLRTKNEEAALQGVLADSESAVEEKKGIQEQVDQAEQQVAKLDKEVLELSSTVGQLQDEHERLCARLKDKRSRLKECDEEISQIEREISAVETQKTDLVVEKKKLANKVEALRKGAHTAEDKCRSLEREYPWIEDEQSHFGEAGSDYDWQRADPAEMFAEYDRARGTIENLSKRVNKKVMQMFEKAEHEYTELKRKKEVVEADKAKIRSTMDDLDEKKREALQTTWKKVDGDLGSIFSMLLPGTMAKLEPVEGTSFMDGLEVKVAFGGVWKESLSELSGGQKSLLALSLILAMLLFKPAPIYILDEVDAALDLSHTQNIGRMIKSHFPHSQFVVVSLKEGMFSNANVIFRTKFVDGVSTVTRTVNQSAAGAAPSTSKAGSARARLPLGENQAAATFCRTE
jgi:structural maintenance of chromosome 2